MISLSASDVSNKAISTQLRQSLPHPLQLYIVHSIHAKCTALSGRIAECVQHAAPLISLTPALQHPSRGSPHQLINYFFLITCPWQLRMWSHLLLPVFEVVMAMVTTHGLSLGELYLELYLLVCWLVEAWLPRSCVVWASSDESYFCHFSDI